MDFSFYIISYNFIIGILLMLSSEKIGVFAGYFTGSYKEKISQALEKLRTGFKSGAVNNYPCANGFQKLISTETWNVSSPKIRTIC